jgi:hypothetical protein
VRGSDAQYQACCGQDAVIRAQYRRTQPSGALRAVLFPEVGFAHFGVIVERARYQISIGAQQARALLGHRDQEF